MKAIAKMSGEGEGIDHDMAAMVSNVFAFDVRTVSQVMIPRSDIITLDARAPADKEPCRHAQKPLTFPAHRWRPESTGRRRVGERVFLAALDKGDGIWSQLSEYVHAPVVVPEMLKLSE